MAHVSGGLSGFLRRKWITVATLGLVLVISGLLGLLLARPSAPEFPFYACPADASSTPTHGNDLRTACPDAQGRGIRLRFFGITTVTLTMEGRSILIDGFFSRPALSQLVLGIQPDVARWEKAQALLRDLPLRSIEAILVAHPHHDHAMDLALVADSAPNAVIHGTPLTHQVAKGWNVELDEKRLVQMKQRFYAGPFQATALPAPHTPSPLVFQACEGRNPEAGWSMPAPLWKFKHDQNHSFLLEHDCGRVLVVPSAAEREEDYPEADVVLLGIGGLGRLPGRSAATVRKYWQQAVVAPRAKLVFLVHWDDFTRPLDLSRAFEPLPALPYLMDNVQWTAGQIRRLLEESPSAQPKVMLLPLAREVELPIYGNCLKARENAVRQP